MAYPEKLLTDDEVILRDFHPHWRVLITAFFWVLVSAVAIAFAITNLEGAALWVVVGIATIAALVLAVPPAVNRAFLSYTLTSERLITRGGILSKSGVEIPLEQINNVLFEQRILERALGYGDVVIESAGSQGRTIFSDIPDPQGFQSEVYRAREERRMTIEGGGPADPTAQLERLARLRAVGDLSDAEYDTAKQRLLGGL